MHADMSMVYFTVMLICVLVYFTVMLICVLVLGHILIIVILLGGFLKGRSWQGLEQRLGETPVTKATEGTIGIAAGYDHEPAT